MTTLHMIMIVCPLVFLGSFVDSIAGGGGLISLPAYLLTGIPVHVACASNKFSACIGSIVSALRFYRNGKVHVRSALISAALSLGGAVIGVQMNLMFDASLLKKSFSWFYRLLLCLFYLEETNKDVNSCWKGRDCISLVQLLDFSWGYTMD